MISSVQYQILKDVQSGKRIDNDKYFNEMLSLRQSGYIALENNHYILRGDWLRVVEEYEAAQTLSSLHESCL